jgi:hypothetical protein
MIKQLDRMCLPSADKKSNPILDSLGLGSLSSDVLAQLGMKAGALAWPACGLGF